MHCLFLIPLVAVALPLQPTPPAASTIATATAPTQPPTPPAPPDLTADQVHTQLIDEAKALRPLVSSDLAKSFLDAAASLPAIGPRTIHRTADRAGALTDAQFAALPESAKPAFKPRPCNPQFYYYTGYGSPLIYGRAIDLAAAYGLPSVSGKRILDFGYGSVGHLRMLASIGADVTGIEVEPALHALYSEPGDTGAIAGHAGATGGTLRLLLGRWPAEEPIVKDTRAAAGKDGFDLIISKNVLKRGYIHPAREADPRRLVQLGVTDEQFLAAVHQVLKPGGVFLIYNISPGQTPPGKPYLPHADGQCPFSREALEKAGFQVVLFDAEDQAAVLDIWSALKISEGVSKEDLAKDLFAWYTLCRRAE